MTTSTRSNKSTNDRSQKPAAVWVWAARMSPEWAATWAERQFFSPRRVRRPAWEHEVLATARVERVRLDEGEMPVWSWGKGPTVVLTHGWEGRGSQLGAFVEPLVEAGWRVVTFDAPAHGRGPGRTASIADFARALTAVWAHLGRIDAVVAHSMGAAATMLAGSRVPIAQKLVFVAPPVAAKPYAEAFARHAALPREARRRFFARCDARLGMPAEAVDARVLSPLGWPELLVVHDRDDREVPFADGCVVADAWHARRVRESSGLGHRRILRDSSVISDVVEFVTGKALRPRGLAGLEAELFNRELRWVA